MPVTLWIGTRKGAFVFRSNDRRKWELEGPYFRGWEIILRRGSWLRCYPFEA